MNIQLSISLLASDKHAALERCLDSLCPLMMQVPSELIVVLTGNDSNIRKIVSQYTDQVVVFEWCNDFSAARNAGMKLARGEWFLFIDDDEWFENTSEIIQFFLSGNYRNYDMAYYKQRNYADWKGIVYEDFPVLRMVRLTPEIHFENPIHEEPVPRYGKSKDFNVYVHHYGYVENANKDCPVKADRNIPLLLQDIQKRPFYVKNYVQITQEYKIAQKWENAEKYCRKGLHYCQKEEYEPYRRWLQADLIEILYATGDYQKAEQEILKILKHACEIVRLIAYLNLNKIYRNQELPEDALHYGLQFEETLAYMDANSQIWQQQQCGHLSEQKIKKISNLYQIRMNCIEDSLKLNDVKHAEYFLALLPWSDELKMHRFYKPFDYLEEQYGKIFYESLNKISESSPYVLLIKAKKQENRESETIQRLLTQCISHTQSHYLQYQALKEAIEAELDISGLLDTIEQDFWIQCCENIVETLSNNDLFKIQKAIDSLFQLHPIYSLLLKKSLCKRRLIRGYLMGPELIDILQEYVQCIHTYYKRQYRDEFLGNENEVLLPKEYHFAILVSDTLEKIRCEDYLGAIRLFRTALPLDTSMTGVITELIRYMMKKVEHPHTNAGIEFEGLAKQMKSALNIMFGKKQYTEALSILPQLVSLLPEDLELLRMKQRLLKEMAD